MIGSIIGAGVGLFSSIFGGISAAKKAKKAEEEMQRQRSANNDWYRRRYNEDYTQTAEAQGLMTKAREYAQDQIRNAVGRQAVMGGTTEVETARKQGADLMSDTLSDLAAMGIRRKENIENQYMQREAQISQQYQNMYNQQAANSTAAANMGMQAGMGMVSSDMQSHLNSGKGLFESYFKKK